MNDWLEHRLSGLSARTMQLYRDGVKPPTVRLGTRPLRKLSAADARLALSELSEHLSTRSLQIAHNQLVRAVRHAETDDLVGLGVAALVGPPRRPRGEAVEGAVGRAQAQKLLRTAADERPDGGPSPLCAYVVLLLITGLRPEEARALHWDHVDLDAGQWRCGVRTGPAVTPRRRSRGAGRGPAEGGGVWQVTGLMFTTTIGTMLDQHNIRRGNA
jgi:integrase